ncbi:MAG: hypothetical protein ABR587_10525 [Candidatus Binatia bacterium]
MKRLLQGLALLQVFLVVALSVRVVRVWTTPLPEVGEIPDLPAVTSLPPPRTMPKISAVVTDGVVEHDLFDDERGQGLDDIVVEGELPAEPVPPPSTVKLMGVMFVGNEPVGILLDSNVQPEQQSVRKGDMFGEYEVGDITKSGLLLLGGGNQQFQIPLRIEAASAAPAAPAPPAPRTPGTAARPAPAARPASARPAPKGDEDKALTARERAQAIAQRNAELRKSGNQKGAAAEPEDTAPDPVQARLEALRQLREAAKSR